jgi:tRNA pseudouridine13 synthase
MVSERLLTYGFNVVEGDLVLTVEDPSELEEHEDESSPKQDPIVITKDNIEKYSLFDVVLPLPGYAVKYPSHSIAEKYQEIMKAEGVDLAQKTKDRCDDSASRCGYIF